MIVVEKEHSFFIAAQAHLVDESQEVAWTDGLIRHDPHLVWIVGRYVEADKPNKNGHIFPLEDLKMKVPTIADKPLNMLHDSSTIIGHYTAAQLTAPDGVTAATGIGQHPFVQTLAAGYSWYAPQAMEAIQRSFKQGALAQSMECVPDQLKCATCEAVFAYKGRMDPSYCSCLGTPGAAKHLLGGVFSGGGMIVSPAKPAWPNADITQLHAWIENELADDADRVYQQVATEFEHLDPKQWEQMMAQVMAAGAAEMVYCREHADEIAAAHEHLAKRYSAENLSYLAGLTPQRTLPDLSYPIVDAADLKAAVVLCQSGSGNVAAARRHIVQWAKTIDAGNLLPDNWKE